MNLSNRCTAAWIVGLGLLLAALDCSQLLQAGTIGLTATQRARLATLVETNAEARQLFKKLQREADASLDDPGHPVVTIETAGKLNTDPAKVASRAGLADMRKLQALGCVFAVSSNDVYSAAARRIILSWARINRPTGVPIDETKFEPLLVTYDQTRTAFSREEILAVEAWLRQMAKAELDAVNTDSITATNNWNSHRLKTVGLIGYLLDDDALIARALDGFKKQVADNLLPDGSSLDFHERDAVHYHCYDLEPLLALSRAARENGVDLYAYQAPSGSSLPKSVEFLVPYCDGTKTHAEWVHSKVLFDRKRAEAGEARFKTGSLFDPRDGLRAMELAASFDDQFKPLVGKLSERPDARFPTWQTVLNEASRP